MWLSSLQIQLDSQSKDDGGAIDLALNIDDHMVPIVQGSVS